MGNNLNLYAVFGDGDTIPAPQPGRDRDARRVHRGQHPGCGYPHRAAEGRSMRPLPTAPGASRYTTCQKCGYHNWTRQGNVYVCDTCGNTTTTVVGP